MSNFLLLVAVLMMVGCAHVEQRGKALQFPFASSLVEKIQMSVARAPASYELDASPEMSTRRVYFSSLYHQYLTLAGHLNKSNDLSFCPQFHHDKLETEFLLVPKVSVYKKSSIETQGMEFFPELVFSKKFSLSDYHQMIRTEIDELCEQGLSDNFYKFDNLVTNYAHKKSFHLSKTAMASVLKIPIFANFYLIKMLQGSTALNGPTAFEKRFIAMTQTTWFERYVYEANSKRNNFIKNKMVRR